MLEINGIGKSFDKKSLFDDFSVSLAPNNIYSLQGENGVGKTTLLKIIKGILIPDQGTIKFQKKDINFNEVAYIDANNRSFFHRLSVWQNLEYFLALNNCFNKKDLVQSLANIFEVDVLLQSDFSRLSSGQMQIFAIIRGLCERPNVLLLDESLANLDKTKTLLVCGYLEEFVADDSKIVIVCSHDDNLPIKYSGQIKLC